MSNEWKSIKSMERKERPLTRDARKISYMQLMVSKLTLELNEQVTIQCLLEDTSKAFESKDIPNGVLICYIEDETGKKYSIASGVTDEKGRHDFMWRTRHAGVYKFSAHFEGDTNYADCWSHEVAVEWKKYTTHLTIQTSNSFPGQGELFTISGQLTDQKGEKLSGVDLHVFTAHTGSGWVEIMEPPRRVLCTDNDGGYKMLVYVPKAMDDAEALFAQEPYSDDKIWDPAAYIVKYYGDDSHIKCENGISISPEV